jgi:hypothetical protein
MRFRDLITAVNSSRDRDRPRVDRRLHRRIGVRSFTSLVNNDNENPEIAIRDLIAAVKSSSDLDRSFVWTRGSQEASSAIRGSGVHNTKNTMHQELRNREMRFREVITAVG